ncbi:uncharacterized protein LOC143910512 [Arctopsyche grandis]|uniref:uncharacterized protein LOC143910512 n=1 Tax=Arctopsyche grandis TaxID=121162 RepID=UPI00406D6D33
MNDRIHKQYFNVKKRNINSNNAENDMERSKTPLENDDVMLVSGEASEIAASEVQKKDELEKIKPQQKVEAETSGKNYNMLLLCLVNDLEKSHTNQEYWKKKVNRLTGKNCKAIISHLTEKKPREIMMNLDVSCFKILLHRWKGWSRCAELSVDQLYSNLHKYLTHNWNHVEPFLSTYIDKVQKKELCKEEGLVVSCPLKWLKSLFYFKAVGNHVYNMTLPKDQWEKHISTECLSNWPFVSIRMTLPNFEMVHKNFNHDEFAVVNLNHRLNNFIADCPMNTKLHYRHSQFTDTYISSFVITYISQLKFMLTHQSVVTTKKRDDIMAALNEFTKDLVLATDSVDTNTEYYANLTPHPYIRYLGDNTPPPENVAEEETVTVRLKQITYPAVKFELVKFSCQYNLTTDGKLSFILSDNFASSNILNNCLSYECTLCNLTYNSFLAPYELSVHLVNNHGFEPNWLCSFCGVSFNTEDLSLSRWSHSCKYNP